MRRKMRLDPPPVQEKRAYLVRGLNMLWAAKSADDGRIICEKGDRIEAATEAARCGYVFSY